MQQHYVPRIQSIKRHNTAKKCHNVTKKCNAMTFCDYGNDQKVQRQNVGYVKERFFAHPLSLLLQLELETISTYVVEILFTTCLSLYAKLSSYSYAICITVLCYKLIGGRVTYQFACVGNLLCLCRKYNYNTSEY